MPELQEYKNWIKTICGVQTAYIGRIDASKTFVLGVYERKSSALHRPFGRLKAYDVKRLTVLVHGSASKTETERFARQVYEAIDGAQMPAEIAGHKASAVIMQADEPQSVDYDANSIYEYVIDFDLIMEV